MELKKFTVGVIFVVVFTSLRNVLVAVNRLDRLTSGLLILPLVSDLARTLGQEFVEGKVKKEYIARCRGEFPVYVLFKLPS